MLDKYSDDRVSKLHPKVRQTFFDFINECEKTLNIVLRITIGYRTIDEQNELYAQGRTNPGNIVTKAKGGQSFHNFGLAVDLAVVVSGKIDWNYDMALLKPIALKYGIKWGGDWKSIKDKPHFEITFGFKENCSELLAKVNAKLVDKEGYVII